MSTPALARATGELWDRTGGRREISPPPGWADAARAVVSAALHDPDDPDWLARTILGGSSATRWASLSDELRDMYRREADAVRAAILGEQ